MPVSLNRLALAATWHCLTGCAIGEILGLVIATALGDALFWWSLAVSLALAFVAAFPVNRLLIAQGRGHAVMHGYH